jgi:beta-glucosidase
VDGSTGDVACDHYHRYEADLDLMKSLGLTSYRFSLSWPRILPTGRGPVNAKGLDFYRRLIDGLHQRGITPMPTLFHWDLPQALQDLGGWENRDCAQWFGDYASLVFQALGSTVSTWMTINEAKTIVYSGYIYGTMAPGKRDQAAAFVASHHLALAHGRAVAAFRAAGTGGRIGPVINLAPIYPLGDGAAAKVAFMDGVQNRMFLDPILKGSYPADAVAAMAAGPRRALEGVNKPGDLAIISAPVDLLGVNYYNPIFIDANGRTPTVKPTSAAPWEQIYAPGLTDLLVRLTRDYGRIPIVITENGMPDPTRAGTLDDTERISYLHDHIAAAHQAIQAGVPLEGYILWSFMDNFEWSSGYTQRWGIVHVDFATQQRTPKRSAQWFHDVITRNAL